MLREPFSRELRQLRDALHGKHGPCFPKQVERPVTVAELNELYDCWTGAKPWPPPRRDEEVTPWILEAWDSLRDQAKHDVHLARLFSFFGDEAK
jgi:hypothetical protein